jgi:hypothetical protein
MSSVILWGEGRRANVVLFLESDRFRLACCNSRRLGSLAGSETIVIGVDELQTTTVLSSSMLSDTSSIKPAKNDSKGDDNGGADIEWLELIVRLRSCLSVLVSNWRVCME